eukprot:s3861_g4.t1
MGEAAKVVVFGRFKRVATSFRVAGVALRDIPASFKTCRKREDLKAAEICTVHAECQTFECDFLCNRCELKSRELDKVLGELLVEQKKVSSGQTEVQESRSQLVAARERLVELGNEAREQKLQNNVQAKRLERALKEWNASETERRRSECQVRVLEQEVERLRKDLSSASAPRGFEAPPREATPEAPLAAPRGERPVVKRVSWPGPKNAVLDKARLLEEKMREDGRTSNAPRNEVTDGWVIGKAWGLLG